MKFLSNKKPGFFLMFVNVAIAIFLVVYFFLTMDQSMSNNAAPHIPVTIGIFAILGLVVQIVAIVLYRFRWVELLVLGAFAPALIKEVYLIPNPIADRINDVAFQGGNLEMQIVYLATLIVLMIIGILIMFFGSYKPTEEEASAPRSAAYRANMPRLVAGLIVAVCGVAAAVSSTLVITDNFNRANQPAPEPARRVVDVQKEFGDKVVEYAFNPKEVIFTEENNPYASKTNNEIRTAVGSSTTRSGRNLVYTFEGFYAEGYQGDYSKTYGNMYLWDDGLYNGAIGSTNIYGYWVNQEADGKACLILHDTRGVAADMAGVKSESSFYDWETWGRIDFSWGQRTMNLKGYYYYPTIGMYIDTGSDTLVYEVGSTLDRGGWTAMRVLNDLRSGPIFDPEKNVKWEIPTLNKVGTKTVSASWEKYKASVDVKVDYDKNTYTADLTSADIKKAYRLVDAIDLTGVTVVNAASQEAVELSKLDAAMDVEAKKIVITLPNGKVESFDATIDDSAAANTITAKTDSGKEMTIVVNSREKITVTVDGKTAAAKVEMTGTTGLATVRLIEKIEGDDEVYALIPKSFRPEEESGKLIIPDIEYYMSTTKANTGTGGPNGPSQTGNTYFAITAEGKGNYLTAFWNWTYSGDEALCLKCAYTFDTSAMRITLTSCLAYNTRDEWQYCGNKTHTVTKITAGDVPSKLTSAAEFVIY